MLSQLVKIVVITLVLLAGMFWPFFPGEYDSFAGALSAMIQLFAMAGLVLVVIGLLWIIFNGSEYSRRFAIAAWIAGMLVLLIASLGAFMNHNRSAGILLWLIGGVVAVRNAPKANAWYLVCIPLILFIARWLFIERAVAYSRDSVVAHAQPLINDIEEYYKKNGHYPVSLLSIWEDYKPGITGIRRYNYELHGAAYNLYFEQFSNQLSVKEVVMYNKLDQQVMTSHNQDLLLLDEHNLNLQRGYFKAQALPQSHWKYFWFD